MSEMKEEKQLGLGLSLDELIKARQAEKKDAPKRTKRTPIKSKKTKGKQDANNAQKSVGSGKAKRNANISAKRGLTPDAKPSKAQLEREIYRQQRGSSSQGCKVYVGNLSWEATWKDLKDFMYEIGDVRHADVMKGPDGRSKGYGIVEFASVRDAKEACRKLNDSEFMGRTIYVREDRDDGFSGNRGPGGGSGGGSGSGGLSVYVGNLPFDLSWQDLKDHMRAAGNVDKANIIQGKGYGIVTYQHPKDAQRAIRELNDTNLGGRNIHIREDREDGGGKGKLTPSGLSVFVGNLPFDIKWQDLKDHMRRAGNVDKANIMESPDGRSKGCAIVVYQHPKDAQRAIRELQGTTLGGREIFVREDEKP